jgi:hypothetical protein
MCRIAEWTTKPFLRSRLVPSSSSAGRGSPVHECGTRRLPAGIRKLCGAISQPRLTTGAKAPRFSTASSSLRTTTERSGRGVVAYRL